MNSKKDLIVKCEDTNLNISIRRNLNEVYIIKNTTFQDFKGEFIEKDPKLSNAIYQNYDINSSEYYTDINCLGRINGDSHSNFSS